ncbi:hypothetical protein J8L86_20845 [Shewanella sp. MMG014]|uniref:hypothetical protein n=1 Tax=Shewanella sp. MMG014 TaxID=2822691 RepID=UPI001B384F38|nr:hypothetical protein [Shewanella sp. MMG014]MBQ4892301.1 hypothetical protein [Shewanella sp. MMG014]
MNFLQCLIISESSLVGDFLVRAFVEKGFTGRTVTPKALDSIVSNKHSIYSSIRIENLKDVSICLFDLDYQQGFLQKKIKCLNEYMELEGNGKQIGYVMSVGQYIHWSSNKETSEWLESIESKILFKPLSGLSIERYILENFGGNLISSAA